MPRVIDKEVALKLVSDPHNQYHRIVKEFLLTAPTIDAEPIRHGRWILKILPIGGGDKIRSYLCSECDRYVNMKFDYCPNCGARMDATDTNVGGKGDEEMDLSPLDFLAAEYDRKHPQGIRFVDCMEGADYGACKKV